MQKPEILIRIKAFIRHVTLFQWVLLATILYLFWQISLSGAILLASSEEASQSLSLLAKRTVGFGTALFVFRAAFRKTGWLLALLAAVPLGFGAMWAEDAIVNRFADRTTGQERLEARAILLFNTALVKGAAGIPGLAQSIADNKTRLAAFSKVLGFAIWNNSGLMAEINSRAEPLLAAVYGQEAYDRVDREYARYVSAFNDASERLEKMEKAFRQSNFASWLTDLNKRLSTYAACLDEDCRKNVQAKTDRAMRAFFKDMYFPVVLEDFCSASANPERYVMGRRVASGDSRVCSATEQELRDYARKGLDDKKTGALPELAGVPAEIAKTLTSDRLLSLEQWRELWSGQIRMDIARQAKEEFSKAERYAADGKDAKTGRSFAIGVFLPPVALGFSVSVCFLHIASLLSAVTRKSAVCGMATGAACLLPALFATSTPLAGLAGIYAKWLVFWEGVLFPLGIFRWIIS